MGDEHVPWVHPVRSASAPVDDLDGVRVLRRINEPEGKAYLAALGAGTPQMQKLPLLGMSGTCNPLAAIPVARCWEFDENHVLFTVAPP